MNNNWSTARLRDCGDWYSGGTPSTGIAEYWDGEIPWITASSLRGFYITDSERRITKLGLQNGSRLMPENTIIFIVRGMSLKTEFRVGIARCPVAFGQDCKAIIARPGIEPYFLANVLRAKASEILGLADGASHGTGRLQTDALAEFEVPLPPLMEQQAIAGMLRALDDKIELNRRMNQTLETTARAIFKSWFVEFDPVLAKADGRMPRGLKPELAILFPGAFEDSPLGPIPKGWQACRWGDIATLEYGKSLRGYIESQGPFRVYGTNGPIGWHTEALSDGPGVVIGRKGAYRGIHYSPKPFFVIDTAFYLKPKEPIDLKWAYYELLRRDINGMDSGSAIPSTSRADFYAIPVCLPSTHVLKAFGKLTDAMYDRRERNECENDTLATLRDSLLPKLISGELRVPDAEGIVGRTM